MLRNHRFPCLVRPLRRLPARSWFPGHKPAHDANGGGVANRLRSLPISARTTSAVRRLIPGIVTNSHNDGHRPRPPLLGAAGSSPPADLPGFSADAVSADPPGGGGWGGSGGRSLSISWWIR